MKMHRDQVDVSVDTVALLVADQFPHWRDEPVRPVASGGTVNALFRLGDKVVLRLPLLPSAEQAKRHALQQEQDNARRLAGVVSVEVPRPLGLGHPGVGYPGWWSAYRWIPGRIADVASVADPAGFARDLARFVRDVHVLDTGGQTWDGRSRGGPLTGLDGRVRRALVNSADLIDTGPISQAWEKCLAAPARTGTDVWIHADLMPGNLLVRDGRLAAVIDLGSLCIGDPAVDLMPAWNLLDGAARAAYRAALDIDDAAWQRGRGWALAQAIIALPYYVNTNPHMTAVARATLTAVLDS